MLDELSNAGIADAVAVRLADETDATVAAGYLKILAKSPRASALGPIRARLADPQLAAQATSALWALALEAPLADPEVGPTRIVVRSALAAADDATAGPLTRLLVLIGNDDDVATLGAHLDGADVILRRAVADGLAHRGVSQPLIDRAGDEVVYPFALLALRGGPHDPESIQTLIRLVPPEAHRVAWRDTVLAMSASLAIEDLLTVDDLLQALEEPELALREGVLGRAMAMNDGGLEPIQRQQVLLRLAPVLFAAGRADDALDLLEEPDGIDRPEALRLIHLQAALRSGAFQRAAELSPTPLDWIEALADLADDAAAAWALRDEIDARFPTLADEAARTRLEQLTGALPPRPTGGSATAAGGDVGPGGADSGQ